MSENLSAKILSIFAGRNVETVKPYKIERDPERERAILEQVAAKKRELGERYKHDPKNFVKRIDGRTFERAAA